MECKYRLPCNWCEKFDKFCDMVKPIEIKLPDPYTCDHDWIYDKTITSTAGQCAYYHCPKCGAIKMTNNGVTYESGKWQP